MKMKNIRLFACMTAVLLFLSGCGLSSPTSEDDIRIGIALACESTGAEAGFGNLLAEKLKKAGMNVDLEFSGDAVSVQKTQIQTMVANASSCIVLARAKDSSDDLSAALGSAKAADIPVIEIDASRAEADPENEAQSIYNQISEFCENSTKF